VKRANDLRLRPRISWLTLALGVLATPAVARADLLVNELGDRAAVSGVVPQDPARLGPATAYSPLGPATRETAPELEPVGLLALVGVCIHPPVNDPGSAHTSGGGVISGSSGGGGGNTSGGGGHITSTSPEPTGLLIGLIGAGVAGVTAVSRRRRVPVVA
jgi:hypothetical protein